MASQAPVFRHVASALALFIALGTGGAYAADTVFSSDIKDGEVKREDIASGAVVAAKIMDGTVTAAKIQSNAVTTAKIPTGAITASRLANTAVASKLNNLMVRENQGTGAVNASCNPGETIIGGGGRAFFGNFSPLGGSQPVREVGSDRFAAWNVSSVDPSAGVLAYAVCLVP